jgi:hypothetical protein
LFCFSVVGFLCKETYGLSAIVLVFFWLLYWRKGSLKIAFPPLLIIAGALGLVIAFNLATKSIFLNFVNAVKTEPYYVNLTPASVFHELFLYASEGLNFPEAVVLAIVAFFVFFYSTGPNKQLRFLFAACLGAAFFAWVPNALIPNHHNGGYSFSGAYLLFLPFLFIPILWRQKMISRYLIAALLIAALSSPLFNKKPYAKQWWVLEQETTQRNILQALDSLMESLRPGDRSECILITGLTMPFFPFHHPLALKEYPNSQFATFDVITYSGTMTSGRYYRVKFIKPVEVDMRRYDRVWMFGGNGALIGNLEINFATTYALEKNNCEADLIYPDSTKGKELLSIIKYSQ